MVANAGRRVEFEWNSLPVLGVREKSLAIAGEPINVTSDEDLGWRTLIADAAENQIDITLSGVTKDRRLITDWFAGTRTRTASFTWPNGDTLTGTFMIANLTVGLPYNDAETFEATLQSNGAQVFTPYA